MKKYSPLIFLYLLLIAERFYGIWFLRWAFDEEQNFGGGTAMLKWVLNVFGAGIPNPEMEHLVSIYGIVGKYLAVIPAAMGFALEKILPIDLPIPLGLIFTRIVVSFLPNVLTIVLIHQMIRLVSDSKVFLFSALMLFLFTFKHIETAHYGVSDGLSTFFVVGSVYCFLRFSLEGKRKFLIWTAVACVLTISTKVNVGVVISGVIGGLFFIRWTVGTEHRGTEAQDLTDAKDEHRGTEAQDLTDAKDEHRGTEAQDLTDAKDERKDGETEINGDENERNSEGLDKSCKLCQRLKEEGKHRGAGAQDLTDTKDERRDGETERNGDENERNSESLDNSCRLCQRLKEDEHRGTEAQDLTDAKDERRDGERERNGDENERNSENLDNSCKLCQRLKEEDEHRGTEAQDLTDAKDERRDGEKEDKGKDLVVFGLAAMTAFVLINLPYLVNFGEWYGELERHIHEYPYTIKGTFLTPFYFHPAFGVGFPVLLLALGGMIFRWMADGGRQTEKGKCSTSVNNSCKSCQRLKPTRINRSLFLPAFLFLVLFYIYLAFSRGVIHRWAIPMTPFLVLFAAYFIEVGYRWSIEHFAVLKNKTILGLTGFGVFFLLGIQPLYHVFQFNLGLTASPNTYQELQDFVEKNVAPNTCIYNVEGIKLNAHCSEETPVDIEALQDSSIDYIIFSDFWFSERRYPSSILYLEVIDQRTHGNWRLIRDFIEGESSGWELQQMIQPKHFSDWSTNIAQPPVFYVYKRILGT